MGRDAAGRRRRFRDLHVSRTFVMPNAWDMGSARLLESLGFSAIATTSSGFAATLGRHDQHVSREAMEEHVGALVEAVDIPVSVDAEHGYADEPAGVGETVRRMAEIGAAGISIEDYDPAGRIYSLPVALQRLEAAVSAAEGSGIVLTARAENQLYGVGDLDDTIARLIAFGRAGADVLYAPGITSLSDIQRVVEEVSRPVNVLLQEPTPTVGELAAVGVRRLSTGGGLAFAAYGTLVRAGRELLGPGTHTYLDGVLSAEDRRAFQS